ncbi:hypothetical protein FKM82_019541 [Ascaphus truei]
MEPETSSFPCPWLPLVSVPRGDRHVEEFACVVLATRAGFSSPETVSPALWNCFFIYKMFRGNNRGAEGDLESLVSLQCRWMVSTATCFIDRRWTVPVAALFKNSHRQAHAMTSWAAAARASAASRSVGQRLARGPAVRGYAILTTDASRGSH